MNRNSFFNAKSLSIKRKRLLALVAVTCFISSLFYLPHTITNTSQSDGINSQAQVPAKPQESVASDGSNAGVGRNLTAFEFAQSTNASVPVSIPTNTTYQMGYINTPPLWTGYQLFSGVSSLADNRSWLVNGTLPVQSPWQYDEVDFENVDNGASRNTNENCWGWYSPSAPGTSSGVLYLDHGYYKEVSQPIGDYQDGTEYCAYNQTLFVDRGAVSAVHVDFSFNATQGYNNQYAYPGWDY